MESWKDVARWEGRYQVSDKGRVRSTARRYKNGPRILRPIKTNVRGKRYRFSVIFMRDGARHSLLIHRLVLEAFRGPCPDGMESRHLDDDPTNNKLSNLRWGTPLENAADARRNGIRRTGERNGRAKLKRRQAKAIRKARGKVTQEKLAERYGVDQTTISAIQRGKLWADA